MNIYDQIGKEYAMGRRSDPKIARQINSFLQGADSIINIGAGSGSYEPDGISLTALEPSELMIQQRRNGASPCIRGSAESIPFADNSFSHSMTILSMHHWRNTQLAFEEIKRVTSKRFVALTWDPDAEPFWLSKDYFPEIHALDQQIFPPLSELESAFSGVQFFDVAIPIECIDGFLAAYWARPDAYLNPKVRQSMSTFSKIKNLQQGLDKLERDLKSGEWQIKYGPLLSKTSLDAGYRLAVWDLPC